MKRIVTAILLPLLCVSALAKPRFSADWGAGAPMAEWHIYHYRSENGSIVIDDSDAFNPSVVAMCTFGIGADIGKHLSLLFCTGYMGLTKGNNLIPTMLKLTWAPNGTAEAGVVAFAEGGTGFHLDKAGKMPALARLGAGYRFPLSCVCSLDLSFSVRYSMDHPAVWDSAAGREVPVKDVLKSEQRLWSPMLTISVNF